MSLTSGHLREDWRQQVREGESELVMTHDWHVALNCDCLEVNGEYYHETEDEGLIAWDEINECYILDGDSIRVYGRSGNQYITEADGCDYVEYRGEYYLTDYVGDNDLAITDSGDVYRSDDVVYTEEGSTLHIDDAYYWDSDECWHDDREEDDNSSLWGYGDGPTEEYLVNKDSEQGVTKFGFGMEIEKSELPGFSFCKIDVYKRTGAVLEKDSSVADGFELKTPVYNLMSKLTDKRLEELKGFADVSGVENAGGHIGFSMEGRTDVELLDSCKGFIPLIYAMHKKRISNTYCAAKKTDEIKECKDKFQSIRMRGDYIEFRIFGAVRNFETVKFRLQLFRIIATNLNKSFAQVIGQATNTKSQLHQLLVGDVYKDTDKFSRLITDAVEINNQFGDKKLTQKTVNKINLKLKELCA